MFKAIIACAILLFMPTASAEIKSYEASEEYVMSEFETIDIAKQRAKQKALRAAQELAGVYVQSNTHVVNLMVSNDEIFTLTAGILNLTSVKFSFKELDDLTFIVKATVKADIDSDDLDKYLNRTPAERAALVAQNLELQKAIATQDAQIAELKRQLATTPLDKVSLSEQFAAENKVFLSNQQLSEAGKLYYNGDFNAAITHCSQAIALYPKNFSAFSIRGAIYYRLNDFNSAVADYNQAINFNSSDYKNFYNRGLAYVKLNNYHSAVQDFSRAIELNPNDADSWQNRGFCRQHLGDYYGAQSDLRQAKALG